MVGAATCILYQGSVNPCLVMLIWGSQYQDVGQCNTCRHCKHNIHAILWLFFCPQPQEVRIHMLQETSVANTTCGGKSRVLPNSELSAGISTYQCLVITAWPTDHLYFTGNLFMCLLSTGFAQIQDEVFFLKLMFLISGLSL